MVLGILPDAAGVRAPAVRRPARSTCCVSGAGGQTLPLGAGTGQCAAPQHANWRKLGVQARPPPHNSVTQAARCGRRRGDIYQRAAPGAAMQLAA